MVRRRQPWPAGLRWLLGDPHVLELLEKLDRELLSLSLVRVPGPIIPTTLTTLRPRPNARTRRIPSPDLQSPDVVERRRAAAAY